MRLRRFASGCIFVHFNCGGHRVAPAHRHRLLLERLRLIALVRAWRRGCRGSRGGQERRAGGGGGVVIKLHGLCCNGRDEGATGMSLRHW